MPATAMERQALKEFSVRSEAWHGMLEYSDFAKEWQACVTLGHLLVREVGLFDRLQGRHVRHKLTAIPFHRADGAVGGWVGTAVPAE